MSDLVERITARAEKARTFGTKYEPAIDAAHFEEAAAEITRLRALVDDYREAAKPFLRIEALIPSTIEPSSAAWHLRDAEPITVADFRRLATLEKQT